MLTPFQPVGPYFHVMLDGLGRIPRLARDDARGERITIAGVLRDGAGQPVADGMIELWQADAEGRYHHPEDPRMASADPGFWGYGRTDTDDSGSYRFETIKPGRVPAADGRLPAGTPERHFLMQAPHILVSVYAPGILKRCVTRMYFDDDPANDADPMLQLVPAHRRHTLLATREGAGYRFDIVLQGENETAFFDV
jgi:protocatechuate 3,4-dioxygenase alpha subunit